MAESGNNGNTSTDKEPLLNSTNEPPANSKLRQECKPQTHTTPKPTPKQHRDWCMRCRREVPATSKGKLIPGMLKPGDHIATRGRLCCGRCYDHHAIVTVVKPDPDNRTAVIQVVDVNRKGMECTEPTCERSTSCCCGACWCCSCIHCQYLIEEHPFCDAKWRLTTGRSGDDNNVITQEIKRLDYKSRRNDHGESKDVARKYAETKNDLEYCVMNNNCESLASACVNACNDVDELKKSISLQSRNCWWRLFHFFFWFIQGSFYFLNFLIYGVFVAKDKYFDKFGLNTTFLSSLCYAPNNNLPGFNTLCDWYVVILYVIIFLVIFTFSLSKFYQPLFDKGFICKNCLNSARLDCVSRIITFVIIEGISIYLENPIYKALINLHAGHWTILISIVIVSAAGAFVVYSVSNLVTWVLGMCITCCDANGFTRYFHFRGLPRYLCLLIRRIKRI